MKDSKVKKSLQTDLSEKTQILSLVIFLFANEAKIVLLVVVIIMLMHASGILLLMRLIIKKAIERITFQNIILVSIAILLFSILWTLNKGLRQFIYHENLTGIRFHEIEIKEKTTEMAKEAGVYFTLPIGVTDKGNHYQLSCKKDVFVFGLKIKTIKPDVKLSDSRETIQEICQKRESKGDLGYWYPEDIFWVVGLGNEQFGEFPKYKQLSEDILLPYIKMKNNWIYETITKENN